MARSHRKRARTVDRDEAVDLLNTAFVDGRLTAAEREERVARALAAKHLGELDQVTSDLGLSAGPASAPSDGGWWRRTSRRTKLAIGAAVLVVIGGGLALAEMSDDSGVSEAQEPSYVVPVTPAAVEGLIAEQEAQFGTTKSYGISLQAQISTIKVPTDDAEARYRPWRPLPDGGFEQAGQIRGAGDHREFDLGDVDLDALSDHLATVRTKVDVPPPNSLVLVIEHWDRHEEPRISITVTNDYNESGYIVTDLAGEIIEQRPFGAAN